MQERAKDKKKDVYQMIYDGIDFNDTLNLGLEGGNTGEIIDLGEAEPLTLNKVTSNREMIYKQKPSEVTNMNELQDKIKQEEMTESMMDDLDEDLEDVPEPGLQKTQSKIQREKREQADKIEKMIKEKEKPKHKVYQVSKKYSFSKDSYLCSLLHPYNNIYLLFLLRKCNG